MRRQDPVFFAGRRRLIRLRNNDEPWLNHKVIRALRRMKLVGLRQALKPGLHFIERSDQLLCHSYSTRRIFLLAICIAIKFQYELIWHLLLQTVILIWNIETLFFCGKQSYIFFNVSLVQERLQLDLSFCVQSSCLKDKSNDSLFQKACNNW